jgi:serine/threonine protein kinase
MERRTYELFDEIAAGGMATVHVAVHSATAGFRRVMAAKRLRTDRAEDPAFLTMLADEARLTGQLSHPNLVPVLDVVNQDGALLLVMDLVRGVSLSRLGAREVPVDIAVTLVCDVLSGLEAAHRAGIVHRDISASNVMVDIEGRGRLIDFGIAKAKERAHVTRTGERKGKLAYMPPEQLEGRGDHRVDLYAAGVVLWELLAGQCLFEAKNPIDLTRKILSEPVMRPGRHRPAVPKALDRIVLKALEREPDHRFASACEMRAVLEAAVDPPSRVDIGAWVAQAGGAELERLDALVRRAEFETRSENTSFSVAEFVGRRTEPPRTGPNRSKARWVVAAVPLVLASAGALFWSRSPNDSAAGVAPVPATTVPTMMLASETVSSEAAASETTESPRIQSEPVQRTKPVVRSRAPSPSPSGTACKTVAWVDEGGIKRYGPRCIP